MQCWHCGATVRPTAKICIYCGEALAEDAFDRDVEFAREQEYESARQPTPMRWPDEEQARQPTPIYRPGAEPERESAPMYRPGGDPAVPDQNATPSRDAAPPRTATPQRRGLLSPSRGFVPASGDASLAPRESRAGTSGARPRGDTPPQPPKSPEPYASRSSRSRAPDDDEYLRSRGRDEQRGSAQEDEQRGAHRPARPDLNGWDKPSRSSERGSGDRYDYAGYDDEQRGYRGERGRERDRDSGYADYGGGSSGRGHRGYDEYDVYPDDGRGGPGGRYDARAAWDESAPRGPLEDSWGLPALTGPEASARGWSDEWQAQAGPPPGPQWAPPREREYGPGQSARSARRPPRKTARRKRRGRGLVVMLLLTIGLAITGGGIMFGGRVLHKVGLGGGTSTGAPTFATYTPGPTPTVVAGFKQFASAPSAFVLNYPQDWSQSSQNDTSQGQPDYLDTFAQGGASVTIERSPAFDPAADVDIIQGEVRGGQQAGLAFTETTSAAGLAAIGGEQWTRREYDVNGKNGAEHMAIFACHHNGHGFAIVLRAPAGGYAQLYSTSFKTVLSTFRFAS